MINKKHKISEKQLGPRRIIHMMKMITKVVVEIRTIIITETMEMETIYFQIKIQNFFTVGDFYKF